MSSRPTYAVASEDDGQQSLFASILKKRKRVVLVTAAVTTLVAVAISMLQTKVYEATSAVVVQTPPWQSAPAEPNMATETQVARSLGVARLVRDNLGLDVSPSQLLGQLSVRVPVDSDVLKLTYSSPHPSVAQARALAFAQAYVDVRRSQFEHQVLASASSITGQIGVLTKQLSTLRRQVQESTGQNKAILRAQRDALTTQIGLLQQKLANVSSGATTFAPGSILGPVPLPRSPARPNLVLNTLVALFAGLLLGFGIAALKERRDDRVRSVRDVLAHLGVPVLGEIPISTRVNGAAAGSLLAVGAPGSEGVGDLRRLRANFVAAATNASARSVAVTSIDSQDRATAVAANLAVALATTGKRVVLLSAVQRPARLEEIFSVPAHVGFLDVLAGRVPIRAAVCDSGIDNLWLCTTGSANGARAARNGRVAGPVTASEDTWELLGSDRAAHVIQSLAAMADFILVDTPPLLVDADAPAHVEACDAVLAVATLPTTTTAQLAEARSQLEYVRAKLLGSVVIDAGRTWGKRRPRVQAMSSSVARVATEQVQQGVSREPRQSVSWPKGPISAATGEKGGR
jgi:capsular polysaccharide biosynthesis protein/MinD-like ATPase involved in chromosome partitioning or flagellar assembly